MDHTVIDGDDSTLVVRVGGTPRNGPSGLLFLVPACGSRGTVTPRLEVSKRPGLFALQTNSHTPRPNVDGDRVVRIDQRR